MKNINKTTLFILLTYGVSFLMAGLFYLFGGDYTGTAGIILATTYMFIPALATIFIEKVIHKNKIRERLFISFKLNKWFLVAWLLPPVIAFLAFGIALLFPDVSYSPGMEGMFQRFEDLMTAEQMAEMKAYTDTMPVHPLLLAVLQGLIAGITINAVAGFGEELGWRGFLVRQFSGMNFMKAALIIGIIWGIWHAPIILMGHNYPQHPKTGVLMMTLWCILLSPIFLYILIKSKSVIAASVLHGTLNGTGGIAIIMLEGGNDLTVGVTGLAGFMALLFIITGLFAYDRYGSKEQLLTSKIIL